jgi:hypothetical protein
VRFGSSIGAVFHALAVAGLLIAPLARPAMAMAPSMPAAVFTEMDDGASAIGMPDDMPCCPDQAPAGDCGKVCPLMALCSVATSQHLPTGIALTVTFRLANLVIPSNDALAESLARGPPRRPPKT